MNAGIDLGTSHSLISYINPEGKNVLVPDMLLSDQVLTPSIVYFQGENALVGTIAQKQSELSAQKGQLSFFKRHLGSDQPIHFDDAGRPWYAEGLTALVLKKLLQDFHYFGKERLQRATLTIPAHFNDRQRRGVLYAASMCGLEVLTLLDEPIAAAMHYGMADYNGDEKYYFVFDLGGGTFDCSVVAINNKGVYVLATEGSSKIGGKEFDEAVMQMALDQLPPNIDPSLWSHYQLGLLRKAAQKIKHDLSDPNHSMLTAQIPIDGSFQTAFFERSTFESHIKIHINQCIELSEKCLRQAHLRKEEISAFLLVGGSSQVPSIRTELQRHFDLPPEKIILKDPSIAIVSGAALRSAQISKTKSSTELPLEFKGLSSFHIGIRTMDANRQIKTETMIQRNTLLPARTTRYFYTVEAEQEYISIVITQYLDDPQDESLIGTLKVGPLKDAKLNYQIAVTLIYGQDGTISVEVYDPNNGQIIEHTFDREEAFTSAMLEQKRQVGATHVNVMGL